MVARTNSIISTVLQKCQWSVFFILKKLQIQMTGYYYYYYYCRLLFTAGNYPAYLWIQTTVMGFVVHNNWNDLQGHYWPNKYLMTQTHTLHTHMHAHYIHTHTYIRTQTTYIHIHTHLPLFPCHALNSVNNVCNYLLYSRYAGELDIMDTTHIQ